MAKGVQFPEANALLAAPTLEDEAAGTVYGLHIHRYRDLDNNPQVLSKWELTAEELEEVRRTGVVWFNCWGQTHPPMWISGHDPFVRTKPESVDA
jgi:hypothetical protein